MSDRDAGAKWIERVLGATVPSAAFQRPAAAQSDDAPEVPLPENGAALHGQGDRDIEGREDRRKGTHDAMFRMKGQFEESGSATIDRSEKGEVKEERKRRERAEDRSGSRKGKEKQSDSDSEEAEDGLREAQNDDRDLGAIYAMYEKIFETELDKTDTYTIEYWLSVLQTEGKKGTRDAMLLMQGQFGGSGSATTDRSEKGEAKEEKKRRERAEDRSGSRKGKEKESDSDSDEAEEELTSRRRQPEKRPPAWPSRSDVVAQEKPRAADDDAREKQEKRDAVVAQWVARKVDQGLNDDELDSCLAALGRRFGDAVGNEVCRDINLRQANGKKIRGGEVQAAAHKAMTMVSPLTGLKAQEEAANARLALAQEGSTRTGKELREAEATRDDCRRKVELLHGDGQGNASRLKQAELRHKKASAESGKAQKELTAATEQARQATASRDIYERSLKQPFAAGDDAVRLEGKCQIARKRMSGAASELEDAEKALKQGEGRHKLAELRAGQDSHTREDIQEAVEAKRALGAAEAAVVKARETLKTEAAALDKTEDRLAMLQGGPALRRVQGLVDNLADHPELERLIEQRKPSTTGNKATALAKGAGKLAVGMIPGVGIGMAFGGAILSENQERRLNGAISQLSDCPMAAVMAECVARSKESEKNKKGIAGAVGMVATAATLPVAGGVGVLAGPTATAAFGAIGGHAAVTAGGKVVGTAAVQGASALAKKGTSERRTRRGDQDEQPDEPGWPGLPEGSALPTIPGDGGDSFDLNDPPIGLALLEFLGPKRDAHGPPAQEQRRIALRQEMFGSGPDLDLVKGKTKMTEADKQIRDELDQGGTERPQAAKADKLRLLYIALGWLG